MPKYDYVALDSRGAETKGSIEAASQNEAIGRVKDMQLFPTKVAEAASRTASKASYPRHGGLFGRAPCSIHHCWWWSPL